MCGGKGTLRVGSGWQKIGHPAAVLDVAALVCGRIVWAQRAPTDIIVIVAAATKCGGGQLRAL
jgi:hypothetical protein